MEKGGDYKSISSSIVIRVIDYQTKLLYRSDSFGHFIEVILRLGICNE
jgi:hypothetical protein